MRLLAVPIALLGVTVGHLASQGIGCADTKYPPQLPPPNVFVDSVHAIADLGAFVAPGKSMVFSVVFNEDDSVAKVRPLNKDDAAAAVSLTNYVRRETPVEALWAFRVRIVGGDAPSLTLERSQYCPPRPRSGGDHAYAARMRASYQVVRSGNPRPIPSEPSIEPVGPRIPVEALISTDGTVVLARVVKSSGDTLTDEWVLRDLKHRKFEPAKLDGQPIQSVYRPEGESPRP